MPLAHSPLYDCVMDEMTTTEAYRLVFPDTDAPVIATRSILGSGQRELWYVELAGENDRVCFFDEFPSEVDFIRATTVRGREEVVIAINPEELRFLHLA